MPRPYTSEPALDPPDFNICPDCYEEWHGEEVPDHFDTNYCPPHAADREAARSEDTRDDVPPDPVGGW